MINVGDKYEFTNSGILNGRILEIVKRNSYRLWWLDNWGNEGSINENVFIANLVITGVCVSLQPSDIMQPIKHLKTWTI